MEEGFILVILIHKKDPPSSNNTINVSNSSFDGNIASYGTGGGLSIHAFFVHMKIKKFNQFKCMGCHFMNNSAQGGAAVSASHGVFIKDGSSLINQIRFIDCNFENNLVIVDSISGTLDGYQNGAFLITEVQVTFAGVINFTGNNGTALYLDSTSGYSTTAEFDTNSLACFSNNSGYKGGAMVLVGKSALITGDNSSFYFMSNTATKFGGAICALTSRFIYRAPNINRKTCFLKMRDNRRPSLNASFHFFSNTAAVLQQHTDIYTTSIEPCNTLCGELINGSNTSFFFKQNCLGKFMFSNSMNHVVTSPKNFTIDFIDTVMPGIAAPLKITQYDEIGNDVSQIFPFTARVRMSRLNTKVASYLNNFNCPPRISQR